MPDTDAPAILRNDELLIRRDAAFLLIDPDGRISLLEDGVNVRTDDAGRVEVRAVVVSPAAWLDPAGWLTVSTGELGSLVVRPVLLSTLRAAPARSGSLWVQRRLAGSASASVSFAGKVEVS